MRAHSAAIGLGVGVAAAAVLVLYRGGRGGGRKKEVLPAAGSSLLPLYALPGLAPLPVAFIKLGFYISLPGIVGMYFAEMALFALDDAIIKRRIRRGADPNAPETYVPSFQTLTKFMYLLHTFGMCVPLVRMGAMDAMRGNIGGLCLWDREFVRSLLDRGGHQWSRSILSHLGRGRILTCDQEDKARGRIGLVHPTCARRSLAAWLAEDVRARIGADPLVDTASASDCTQPRYFLHGWHESLNLEDPDLELWTTSPRDTFWASTCSIASRISNGTQYIHLTRSSPDALVDRGAWTDEEDEAGRPVLGFIYLLEIPQPEEFYAANDPPRILPFRPILGCDHEFRDTYKDPKDASRIGARIGYRVALLFEPDLLHRPDAYIFPAAAIKARSSASLVELPLFDTTQISAAECVALENNRKFRVQQASGLRIKHTWRVLNPASEFYEGENEELVDGAR